MDSLIEGMRTVSEQIRFQTITEATIIFVSEQDMDVASLVLGTKVGKPGVKLLR